MDEREVLRAWRDLFRDKKTNADVMAKAAALLDGLSGESPLHLRLANELEDLANGPTDRKKKRRGPRQAT